MTPPLFHSYSTQSIYHKENCDTYWSNLTDHTRDYQLISHYKEILNVYISAIATISLCHRLKILLIDQMPYFTFYVYHDWVIKAQLLQLLFSGQITIHHSFIYRCLIILMFYKNRRLLMLIYIWVQHSILTHGSVELPSSRCYVNNVYSRRMRYYHMTIVTHAWCNTIGVDCIMAL